MGRRRNHPEPQVNISFEAARIAPQCLAVAYEQVVPIPRRPMRQPACKEGPSGPVTALDQLPPRRAERG